jgi:hypothetical protein
VKKSSIATLALQLCLAAPALAGSAGGEYAPIVELGLLFHTGTTGTSITGTNGIGLSLSAEKRKKFIRPFGAFEFERASGLASVGDATPSYALYRGGFQGGIHFFPISGGRFDPFIGGGGHLSWATLQLTSPPEGVEPYTNGLAFGYQVSAGVDMRLGGTSDGNAIRIKSGYYSVTSNLAGISGFQLHAFRISIGVAY